MTLRPALILLALLPVTPAWAAEDTSIKAKVPPDLLAVYCGSRELGVDYDVQMALPDGSVISGTIRCEAADRKSPATTLGDPDPATAPDAGTVPPADGS